MSWEIIRYDNSYEGQWDKFIKEESINGTFLQSRKFFNYHPNGRFDDFSLLFFHKGKICAVCPACRVNEDGKSIFYSHKGSTYGGLIFNKNCIRLELMVELIAQLERYLVDEGFGKIILKPTISILCRSKDDVFAYALHMAGYQEYRELNLYIDYSGLSENICADFSKLKKRQVNKCIRAGMVFRELVEDGEISMFHSILSENLKKYGASPVHSVEELLDLKRNRFPEKIKFFGGYSKEELLSGTMVFEFPEAGCAHTQYLAAKKMEGAASPMSFIYYSVLKRYFDLGFKTLSWGIATEHNGAGVNWPLMRNKEEFGSRHCINSIFEKDLFECEIK